jgi:hypothetical protein
MSDIKTIIILTDAPVPEAAGRFGGDGASFRLEGPSAPPPGHVAGGIPRSSDAAGALKLIADGDDIAVAMIPSGALEAALATLLEESPLKTVFALAAPGSLTFRGHGIARGVTGSEAATAQDILPTLAMVGEFLLLPGVTGRVLFEALRNPSYKQGQIGRLKAALARLEKAMKRTEQEPWDKHDCA